MKVCIPTNTPGGPVAPVAESFQDSDFFDFYELTAGDRFALYVQIRNCAGMCKDDVETVVRRGAEAVIVNKITANTLHRLKGSGVEVYQALAGPSNDSLEALRARSLLPKDKIKS